MFRCLAALLLFVPSPPPCGPTTTPTRIWAYGASDYQNVEFIVEDYVVVMGQYGPVSGGWEEVHADTGAYIGGGWVTCTAAPNMASNAMQRRYWMTYSQQTPTGLVPGKVQAYISNLTWLPPCVCGGTGP